MSGAWSAEGDTGNIPVSWQYDIPMSYQQYYGHIRDIMNMQCHNGNIADMILHIGNVNLMCRT
jgi:hypothetical protein